MKDNIADFNTKFRTDIPNLGRNEVEFPKAAPDFNQHATLVSNTIQPHSEQFNLAKRDLAQIMSALDHEQITINQLDTESGLPTKNPALKKATHTHIQSASYSENGDPYQSLDSLLNYFTNLVKWTDRRHKQTNDNASDLTARYKQLAKDFFDQIVTPLLRDVKSVVAQLKISSVLTQLTSNGISKVLLDEIGLTPLPKLNSAVQAYSDSALGSDLGSLLAFVSSDEAKARALETLIEMSRLDLPFTQQGKTQFLAAKEVRWLELKRKADTLLNNEVELAEYIPLEFYLNNQGTRNFTLDDLQKPIKTKLKSRTIEANRLAKVDQRSLASKAFIFDTQLGRDNASKATAADEYISLVKANSTAPDKLAQRLALQAYFHPDYGVKMDDVKTQALRSLVSELGERTVAELVRKLELQLSSSKIGFGMELNELKDRISTTLSNHDSKLRLVALEILLNPSKIDSYSSLLPAVAV